MFHTIFVAGILRFSQCKDNEGFLYTLSFSSKFLLMLAKYGNKWCKRLKKCNVFRLKDITIDILFFTINWKNYFDSSILVISMTVLWDRWLSGPLWPVYNEIMH